MAQQSDFRNKVVLAKVGKATFHRVVTPGEQLVYHAEAANILEDGAIANGTCHVGDELIAEVQLFFAFLGYILNRLDVPSVPIVLGIVLGPIFEGRFRQALGGANGDFTIFFTRPISATLLAIMIITVLGFWWSNKRQKAKTSTN